MSGATDSGMIRTMGVVIGALVLLAIIIMVAARSLSDNPDDPNDPVLRAALINRIGPVASVRTSVDELPTAAGEAETVTVDVATAPKTAEELYAGVCAACHDTGVAEAPILGDEAVWATRKEKGLDALVASAINGIGTMPARGGSSYSDEEMRRTVQYVAGFEVDEPAGEPVVEIGESADVAPAESDNGEESAEVASDSAEESADAESVSKEPEAALEADVASGEESVAESGIDAAADSEVTVADEATASESLPEEAVAASDAAPAGEVLAAAVAIVGQEPAGLSEHVRSTVDSLCVTCHLAGVGGAPKMGDQVAWQARADKGMETLTASVINGLGVMPPRGATTLTDEEIPIAIQYLMSK